MFFTPLVRRLGPVALAGLWVGAWFLVNGYQFGGGDHAVHFAFIERARDATYLAGDPLVDLSRFHPALLWPAIALLETVAPLEAIYLVLQIVSTALMLAGVAALAKALSPRPVAAAAAVLAAFMVLFVRLAGAGLASFDIMVLNRSLSLGPLLFALAWAAQGRYRAAFLLAGLTFNLHATTAVHGAILVGFAAAFGGGRWRDALRAPLWFIVGAAPLWLTIVTTGGASGVPFPPPADWLDAQRLLTWFHHFPSLWPGSYWTVLLAPLVAIGIGWRARRQPVVPAWLCGIAAACVAGYAGVEVAGWPTALHLHLQETLRFLPYIAAAVLAGWAATTWVVAPAARWRAAVAVLALALDQAITYPHAYAPASTASLWVLLAVGALEHWRPLARPAGDAAVPALRWPVPGVLAVLLVAALGGHLHRQIPIVPSYAAYPESRLAAWSRQHLPADAVLAIPPYYYLGHDPLVNFRWAAQRRVLVTLKDGGETTFSLAYYRQWRERIEDAIGRPLDLSLPPDFRQRRDDWIRQVLADYGTADAARFQRLASRHGVTHAITEARAAVQPALPLLYQDERYRLYQVTPP